LDFNYLSLEGDLNMKRREFLQLGAIASAAAILTRGMTAKAQGAAAKPITDKDILKDAQPAPIANYCNNPDKQPNKACPGWKDKPGHCETCMFFNKDNSLTSFKGGKYARCQLLTTDPNRPQFVNAKGWCASYTALPKT
jgi:hypothetical protein